MNDPGPVIVFMGSPDFAVPTLQALNAKYRVAGVVTQPDRPAGRGRILTPPPIKELADALGLPVIQPNRLREPEAMDAIRSWSPDLIAVAAFGQILRSAILDLPRFGCINVHASLLPRWRGAAPIQAAIRAGDFETGVTIMRMDAGIDTGPILSQRSISIAEGETAGELSDRLAILGAELLINTLPGFLSREIQPEQQEENLATYAPMLRKEDGELDFNRPAAELERQVRAFQPWPGAFMPWQGGVLKVIQSAVAEGDRAAHQPAQREVYRGQPAVWTSRGLLVLTQI